MPQRPPSPDTPRKRLILCRSVWGSQAARPRACPLPRDPSGSRERGEIGFVWRGGSGFVSVGSERKWVRLVNSSAMAIRPGMQVAAERPFAFRNSMALGGAARWAGVDGGNKGDAAQDSL